MSHLYYRLLNTTDPEERLEDAAMYKALHDIYGKGLTLVPADQSAPKNGLFLGRGKSNEANNENVLGQPGLAYWDIPAFRNALDRSLVVTDLDGAEAEVKRLHAEGEDAFLKSTRQKHLTLRINQGTPFYHAMDGIAESFMDRENCLMVQQAVDMRFEHRFLVMNGKVITHSPVALHLTPLSRSRITEQTGHDIGDMHYSHPESHDPYYSPQTTDRMIVEAQRIATLSKVPHLCIDLCILGPRIEGPVEVIEFNPMQPGAVGLYACDPIQVAEAVWRTMDPELRDLVEKRRTGEIPPGIKVEQSLDDMARDMVRDMHSARKNDLSGTSRTDEELVEQARIELLNCGYPYLDYSLVQDNTPDETLNETLDEEPWND